MPRNKRRKDEDNNDGNWMTTYSDMVTLLLVFFVLLYSFSSVDAEKFEMLIEGLRGKLGVLDGGQTVTSGEMIDAGMMGQGPGQRELRGIYNKVSKYIQQNDLQQQVSLEINEQGLVIRFTGKILFDLGEAEIKENAHDVLKQISDLIKTVPNEVMVEGHTDNWPISNSEYPTNWELSTARATTVVRYFIEENNINPARLSAAGYSKYKPLYPNDTPEHRSMNRRVDVIIKRQSSEEGEDMINE